ncbi:MAG: hypothetical protein JWN30_2758 [Bacilli bacterium]|nr:hypothetical protein [Bacilli bacterium]
MNPDEVHMPLLHALESHIQRRPLSLHVPGHKAGVGLSSSLGVWLGHAAKLDLTELPGLDDLHHPAGAILEAQRLAAQAFGAERTYFLVNGSTCGNYAMISAVCRPGDLLLVARDCHVSVLRGLQLSGVVPIYLVPEVDARGATIGISPAAAARAVDRYPQAKGILITSPSYQGACSRLQEIAAIAHSAGMLLLVDEAHGAHFRFHPNLPQTAMEAGADLAVQSTHKTLGSLTQSAMLHAQGSRFSYQRLEAMLRKFQSTSPSYLLMASLDAARAYMQAEGEARLGAVIGWLASASRELSALKGVRVVSGAGSDPAQRDPLRWWIDCSRLVTGFAAAEWLNRQMNLVAEYADLNGFLLIWSYADSRRTIERTTAALLGLGQFFKQAPTGEPVDEQKMSGWLDRFDSCILPSVVYTPTEAENKDTCPVSVDSLDGKVAGEAIVPYPPGIPYVLPGERWTVQMRDAVRAYVQAGGILQGAYSPLFTHTLIIQDDENTNPISIDGGN